VSDPLEEVSRTHSIQLKYATGGRPESTVTRSRESILRVVEQQQRMKIKKEDIFSFLHRSVGLGDSGTETRRHTRAASNEGVREHVS